MRVLLLTLHFAPDTVSNAVVVTELAEELASRGHQVTVVAALPYHQNHRIELGYGGRLWQADWHGPIRVFRTWLLLRGRKQDVGGRFVAYGSFNLTSSIVAACTGPHDVVITPSPPLTIGLFGWLLARRWNAAFVYNVQDIYPDASRKLGLLPAPGALRFFSALERFVYERADAVTVVSEDFRQNLLAKGVPDGKIGVIPNGVDTDFIRPGPRENAFAREHDLVGRFVVLYAGNIGMAQGIETLVETARLSGHTNKRFLIVGDGAGAEVARAAARELSNVGYLPFQPRARLPEVYASADVGVVLLRPGMATSSMPSKVYSIMAAGKPVAACVDPGSEAWRLIERVGCGICVPAGDASALAQSLDRLRNEGYSELGERGRRYVEEYQTRGAVGQAYHQLLSDLGQSRGARIAGAAAASRVTVNVADTHALCRGSRLGDGSYLQDAATEPQRRHYTAGG
jgi:putative colanic acid biosynthesis glycosyltransferase WcaI